MSNFWAKLLFQTGGLENFWLIVIDCVYPIMAPEDLILGSEWVWGPLGAIYMAVSGAKFFTLVPKHIFIQGKAGYFSSFRYCRWTFRDRLNIVYIPTLPVHLRFPTSIPFCHTLFFINALEEKTRVPGYPVTHLRHKSFSCDLLLHDLCLKML